MQVSDQETFVTALGIEKEARWGWSDEEGPAQWSGGVFFAGSWVAVAPTGSWGCAAVCQLLIWLVVWLVPDAALWDLRHA